MYILLTNDDGIESTGLRALVNAAVRRGHEVLLCAPSEQQSAASQRIQLNTPIMVRRSHEFGHTEAWAISGTPADCVRIAYELTERQPDICISGINDGENAGCAVFYSGTVAAAREAAMHYTPAFAVSVLPGADADALETLAEKSLTIAENSSIGLFPRLSVVNINAPATIAKDWKGIRYCTLSQAFYHDTYEHRQSPRGQDYYWVKNGLPMEEPEPDSDYYFLRQGYMTVSVIGGFADLNQQADHYLHLNDRENGYAR